MTGINNEPTTSQMELSFRSDYSSLVHASAEIKLWLESQQLPMAVIYFVTLTIDEMSTRCIRFGYQNNQGHLIDCKLSINATDVTLRLIDDASPYNPASHRNSMQEPDAQTNKVEGLGMMLVRTLANEIFYARQEGKNVTTFRKKRQL